MKVTYFGTTTLLFDDGKDQILFDCHFTRPSLAKYIRNAKVSTDTQIMDKLFELHRVDRHALRDREDGGEFLPRCKVLRAAGYRFCSADPKDIDAYLRD